MIMTLFSIILAAVIHYYGKEIIDFVAGEATSEVKDLALTYGNDGAELSGGCHRADW